MTNGEAGNRVGRGSGTVPDSLRFAARLFVPGREAVRKRPLPFALTSIRGTRMPDFVFG